jgi:hypothetical protein
MSRASAIAFLGLLAFAQAALAADAEVRKHALVIGINGLGLNFADKDAQAFASFIETPEGGSFPHGNVRILVNKQADREGILVQGIAWVGKRVREDRDKGYGTLVYVFFAGHGQQRPNTGEAYLLPFGADPDSPQGLGIRADDFVAEVRKEIQATAMVYFLDACHAGASVMQGGIARDVRPNVYSSLDTLFRKDIARRQGARMGFLSAQAHQESFEDPKLGHGVFTYYLLQGLQKLEADQKPSGNGDGVVSADELVRYLGDKVPDHVKAMFIGASAPPRQYPEASPGYEHEFPLAVKPQPAILTTNAVDFWRRVLRDLNGREYTGSTSPASNAIAVRNGLRITESVFYVGDDHKFLYYANRFPVGTLNLKYRVHWESEAPFRPTVVCSGPSSCTVPSFTNLFKDGGAGKADGWIGQECDVYAYSPGRYTMKLVSNGVSVAETSFEIVAASNVKATFLGTDLAGPTVIYLDRKKAGTISPKGQLEVVTGAGMHSFCIEDPEIACESRYLPPETGAVFEVTNTSVKRALFRSGAVPPPPAGAVADSPLKISVVGEDGKPISGVQVIILHKDGTFDQQADAKPETVGLTEAVMCAKDGYSGAYIPVTGADVTCRLKSTPGEGARIFTNLWHWVPDFPRMRLDLVPAAGGRVGLKTPLRINGSREPGTVSLGESFRVTDVFGLSRELRIAKLTGKLALVEYRKLERQPPKPGATRISTVNTAGAPVMGANLAVLEKNKTLTEAPFVVLDASVDLTPGQIETVLCWGPDYGAGWIVPVAGQPMECKLPILKGGGSKLFYELWGYVPGFTQKRLDLLPLPNGRIQLKTVVHVTGQGDTPTAALGEWFTLTEDANHSKQLRVVKIIDRLALVEYK